MAQKLQTDRSGGMHWDLEAYSIHGYPATLSARFAGYVWTKGSVNPFGSVHRDGPSGMVIQARRPFVSAIYGHTLTCMAMEKYLPRHWVHLDPKSALDV